MPFKNTINYKKFIETILPRLCIRQSFVEAITEEFGDRGSENIQTLKAADGLSQVDNELLDLIDEIIQNEAVPVDEIEALGGYGEFSIEIMEFEGMYWIKAPDFDDIGYFASRKEARDLAIQNYEPFISSFKNK